MVRIFHSDSPDTLGAHRRAMLVLVAIILLAAALRLHGLAARSIWYDEGFTLAYATHVDTSFRFLSPDVTSDAPMMAVLIRIWEAVLAWIPGLAPGTYAYDFLLRLIPCVFSLLAVPLVYLLARVLIEEETPALIAAGLCAISPFQVYYAQEIKPYSLYLALSLGLLICLVRALETDRLKYWIGYVVFLTLCIYSHFFSAWNGLLANFYMLLLLWWHRRQVWKWAGAQIAVLALALPAIILAWHINHFFESITTLYTIPPDLKSGFITFKTFFAGYGPRGAVYWSLFVVAAALFVYALIALRNRPRRLVFVLVFTVVPIAANVIVWRLRHFPMYEHRLFILASAVAYITVAYGLYRLPNRILTGAGIALMAALTVPCLADFYAFRLHPATSHRMGVRYKVQSRDAAAYVASQWQPGDLVGHAAHFTYFPFLYYLQGKGIEQFPLRLSESEREGFLGAYPHEAVWDLYGAIPTRIEPVVARAQRLWWIESWWEPNDLNDMVILQRAWLDAHCVRTRRVPLDGLTVYLYENRPETLRGAARDRVIDQGGWALTYYDLAGDATSETRDDLRRSLEGDAGRAPEGLDARFDLTVADAGGVTLNDTRVDTRFGEDSIRLPELGVEWREGGTSRLGVLDYSLLALDAERKAGVLAPFPLLADTAFMYQCTVRNVSAVPRQLECRIYAAAMAIEPMEFTAGDCQSPVWSPWFQEAAVMPPIRTTAFTMNAHLTRGMPGGDFVYKDLAMAPGRYDVFVRCKINGEPVNHWRAHIRCRTRDAAGTETPVGPVMTNIPSHPYEWIWRQAGTLESNGEPFRLEFAAYNEDWLKNAYFELGRVLLMDADPQAPPGQIAMQQRTIPLPPGETRPLAFSSHLNDGRPRYTVIEIEDPNTHELRSLSFRTSKR